MNKKIAFITPIYEPANLPGSGVFVKDIAEYLAEQGNDVTILTSDALTARYWYDPIFGKRIKKHEERNNEIKVIRLKSNQLLSSVYFILERKFNFLIPNRYKNILKIRYNGPHLIGMQKRLELGKYDVIHVSPLPLNLCLQAVCAIDNLSYSTKTIITPFYHSELEEFKNPEIKKILDKFDKIHVLQDSEQKILQKRFGIEKSRFVKIPLFLKRDSFKNKKIVKKEAEKLKAKYKLTNTFIILFAGNKAVLKGATHLLQAIRELHNEHRDIRLMAIGNSSPAWKSTKQSSDKSFLIDLPYLNGARKEAVFELCDVFAMPSISESFGLVYLEAWHKKKPVIATKLSSTKDLIENNGSGMLVKYGNISDIKKSIIYLKNNPRMLYSLGNKGQIALKNHFYFEKLRFHYLHLFLNE